MRSLRGFIVLVIACTSFPAVARAQNQGSFREWRGSASSIAGTSLYSEGEFIYQDFVFDDTGPSGRVDDIAGLPGLPSQASNVLGRGYAEYPHDWDRYGDNAADIVEVRVAADETYVYYLFQLNTLMAEDSTVVAVSVDEDGDQSTGGGDWPLGANVALPGWERTYTFWGTGGAVTTAGGTTTALEEAGGEVSVDLEENVIEARVPRAVADPGDGIWKMWAATGLWDLGAEAWLPFAPVADEHSPGIRYAGATLAGRVPNIFNIAFRSMDETDDFGTDRQAASLTAGDISPFSAEVDFRKLGNGYSDPPQTVPTGDYTRIYRSHLKSEGIVDLQMRPCYETISIDNQPRRHPTCQEFFLSPYQPYHVHVPDTYDPAGANPLVVTSHGANEYFGPDIEFAGGYEAVDRNGAVVVSTLARGQSTVFLRAAEQDILESIADAKRAFAIDADRVSAVGSSHGGGLVWIMTTLHPDIFSAGMPMIPGYIKHREFGSENDIVLNFGYVPLGPEGDRLFGVGFKVSDLFENLRNIPMRITTGDQDPVSPPGRYELTVTDRLGELGYDYVHYGCSVHTHGPTTKELGQQLLDWLINQVRVEDPRFVVYKGNTGIDRWNEPWGNKHDSAYWVRDISLADPGRDFLVDAESFALEDVRREPTPLSGVMTTGDAPPSVCRYKGLALDPTEEALPLENRLDLDLTNVRAVRLEADRAGLTLSDPLRLFIEADREATITLEGVDPRGHVSVVIDGDPTDVDVEDGRLILQVRTGEHEYTITDASQV
jgi:hypothetical protein